MFPGYLFFAALLGVAHSVSLPSFHVAAKESATALLERRGKWWAQVGDRVYHSPPPELGLSPDSKSYYYALGSRAAVPKALQAHRVGGEGRLHIFHLPAKEVPSAMVEVAATQNSSRRSALSSLKQLRNGLVVSEVFPVYELKGNYVNPLVKSGQEDLEKRVVGSITADGIYAYLERITKLPGGGEPSRSAHNVTASEAVQSYLENQFKSMGLRACRQPFQRQGATFTNVFALVPGSGGSTDTVTVGAHYDSIPSKGAAPGAEDNGSGLAALLALAKAFTDAKVSPKKNVYFVAFAAEESGLLGSDVFANAIKTGTPLMRPECMAKGVGSSFLERSGKHQAIIMDEVGWKSGVFPNATVNLETYDWVQDSGELEHLAQSSRLHNGKALNVTRSFHPFGSDHMSWLSRQMPAVLTINGDDANYPHYHKSSDTIDHVDKHLMHMITKMNMGALLRMASIANEIAA
mmetsp:Transcript_25021/g.48909  ORF Transcript_25021/g.48909 Transcript_25021/m.48909 type:complete len:463 (+) Transcript_25021:3-1391(+)